MKIAFLEEAKIFAWTLLGHFSYSDAMKNGQGDVSGSSTRSRKTKADSRAQNQPGPVPKPGFNTTVVEKAIAAGPAGIRQAQRIALKHAEKFHEDAVDHWRKETDFLKTWTDSSDSFYRVRARWAKAWRPRFLAALSMTHCVQLSCRSAKVSRDTAYEHRKRDPEFAKQWDEAVEHAIDLLHARTFQRALEGDLEPVFFMGMPVGYTRKFSDKLQIEMLRAYRPDRFKSPGTNVNIGTRGDLFVLTEDQRATLRALNRKWLESAPLTPRPFASDAQALPVPALGAPPASTQAQSEGTRSPREAEAGIASGPPPVAARARGEGARAPARARRNSLG
jgi:hypothetical protein